MTHRKPNHGGWKFGKESLPLSSVFPVEVVTVCARGHRLSGSNLLLRTYNTKRECRACVNGNQWARRNGFEKDSEESVNRSNFLYSQYQEKDEKSDAE